MAPKYKSGHHQRSGDGRKPATEAAKQPAVKLTWSPDKDKLSLTKPYQLKQMADHLTGHINAFKETQPYGLFLNRPEFEFPPPQIPDVIQAEGQVAIKAFLTSSTGLQAIVRRETAKGLIFEVVLDCLSKESIAALKQLPEFMKLLESRNDPSNLWKLIMRTHAEGSQMESEKDLLDARKRVQTCKLNSGESLADYRDRLETYVTAVELILTRTMNETYGKKPFFVRNRIQASAFNTEAG